MPKIAQELRGEARRARRLAGDVSDEGTRDRMLVYAQDLEAKADERSSTQGPETATARRVVSGRLP